ncbi:MAG: hypothetical protein ACKVJE_05025 [Pseudomonadales bacterium]|jgi:hypothetical protein
MGVLAIIFVVDVLVSTLCIWLATKFSFVQADVKSIALIVVCVSVVSLIPAIGWLAGIVLFFYLFTKATGCSFVDAIWVILFSKLFSFAAVMAIGTIL